MNISRSPKNMFYLFVLLICGFSFTNIAFSEALISEEKLNEIESSVNSMGVNELKNRMIVLNEEKTKINDQTEKSESLEANQTILERLAEINAELTAIQKALATILGVGAISAITSDDYNDEIPPVITINGDNPATVELGSTYSDPGATAIDAYHGSTNVSSSGVVDTNTVGSYTITYTATDLDNNSSTASRVVNVVDTTAPVVTVLGDNPATVELGTSYDDAGATAFDLSGPVDVSSTGSVNVNTLGSYTITYASSDPSGNVGLNSRTVNVLDTIPPVFTSSSTFMIVA